MMIAGITLDHDLIWEDEYQYTPVTGSAERSIYGNLVVQTFSLFGGQPLTLVGGSDFGWQKRSTIASLYALLALPSQHVSVVMPDARVFTAIFRVGEAPVMSFTPVTLASAPDADFWYYGTIKLTIIDA